MSAPSEKTSLLHQSNEYLHPKRPGASPLTQIEQAAWHTENAMLGAFPDSEIAGLHLEHRLAYLKFQTSQNPEREIILAVLVFVTFMEVPLWCLLPSDAASYFAYPSSYCHAPDASQIYLSNLPYLPPGLSVPLELTCYAFLLRLVYLNIKASFG